MIYSATSIIAHSIISVHSGYISRKIFKMTNMNLIRKHTLMGMACALAAFFGVPLGGSLFALEINNRFGIEYYEHTSTYLLLSFLFFFIPSQQWFTNSSMTTNSTIYSFPPLL